MTIHFLVPDAIDDPQRPSGGNVYDRRLSVELARLGWTVREHGVSERSLARVLGTLPHGAVAMVDGLVASAGPMVAEAGRLRLVVLLHMPVGSSAEHAVLEAADAVVTTSSWSREAVLRDHGLPGDRVRVAVPGVDRGPRVARIPGRSEPAVRRPGHARQGVRRPARRAARGAGPGLALPLRRRSRSRS